MAWTQLGQGLESGEVHLYQIDLRDTARLAGADPASVLSPDECLRVAGFRYDFHRERYLAARWSLRTLLGGYLRLLPADVPLTSTSAGKPHLQDPFGRLHFNLTHCEHLALIGVAQRHVGIDLERAGPLPELAGIAARLFTPSEHAQLAATPSEQRQAFFYRLWTRREAALKCLGTGLWNAGLGSVEPNDGSGDGSAGDLAGQIEVSGAPDPGDWLLSLKGVGTAFQGWLSQDIAVQRGLQAALVVRDGAALRRRFFIVQAGRLALLKENPDGFRENAG